MRSKEYPELSQTQKAVCDLLANHLFGREATVGGKMDWRAILEESYLQGVQMIIGQIAPENGIPAEILAERKRALFATMLRDSRVHGSHTTLHRVMLKHGLCYTVIKGVASANYYPDPSLRSMGDVDFLVRREEEKTILEVLQSEGYEVLEQGRDHHVILQKDQIRLEMHIEPAGMPEGNTRPIMESYLENMLDTAVEKKGPPAACVCPSDFHHGLIILMHTQHHLLSEGIGLRHLCDWATFVGHFEGEGFADLFREKLKRVGLWQFARLLSVTCALYLGLPEKAWMEIAKGDRDTAKELICDMFSGGNFGVKDPQRAYEGMFISNRGKDGVKQNRLKEGFSSLNRITYQIWPVTRKAPVLLPIGWLVSLGHFVKRNRERKKRGGEINAIKAYQASAYRKELYRKLSLYQPEE